MFFQSLQVTQHEHDRIVTYSGSKRITPEVPLVSLVSPIHPTPYIYLPFFPQNVPFMWY